MMLHGAFCQAAVVHREIEKVEVGLAGDLSLSPTTTTTKCQPCLQILQNHSELSVLRSDHASVQYLNPPPALGSLNQQARQATFAVDTSPVEVQSEV